MEKFSPRRKIVEYSSDEMEFNSYVRDLQLSWEDLNKKILDVGSGSAQFAKWVEEQGISSNIFNLEPTAEPKERTRSVQAKAEAIPFKDETFDLVISNCAIPNIFLAEDSTREKVRDSLLEMMRVTKPGGEIRLGRVFLRHEHESQRGLVSAIEAAAEELKKDYGARIEVVQSDELTNAYLIKIYKPLNPASIKE